MLISRRVRSLHARRTCSLAASCVVLFFVFASLDLWYDKKSREFKDLRSPFGVGGHTIRTLMIEARLQHKRLLDKESHDIETAAARYRARRGRHPPPGFDLWYAAARKSDAVVVEDFFDRIYKDLTPYWSLDPDTLKTRASAWHFVVKVRNGTATGEGDTRGLVNWLELWTDLVEEFAQHLPDVDMPINHMDESRIIVPFDEMATLVAQEARNRRMPNPKAVTSSFEGLGEVVKIGSTPYEPAWHGPEESHWDVAVRGCSPDSPAHGVKQVQRVDAPVQIAHDYRPSYTYKGYIHNWTAAKDPCEQPHIRQLHGTFIEPISQSVTHELIPLFGGSKLPMNNEILIPGAMYLTDRELYSGGKNHHGPSWEKKKTKLIWRGAGSGGIIKADTWHRFQRHRLLDMLNGTLVSRLEAERSRMRASTFELPSQDLYPNWRVRTKQLGSWLQSFADAQFVRRCYQECDFLADFFKTSKEMPMKKQYRYKFLPDVDGNSFSARFLAFLRSTSLPLKATIYNEWHDDRLVPWLHFVPFDMTFQDLYSILAYFGDGDGPGDVAAQLIAERGKEWAERALRREDMALYVWRLLLEWARVCDRNRDSLGFVGDL